MFRFLDVRYCGYSCGKIKISSDCDKIVTSFLISLFSKRSYFDTHLLKKIFQAQDDAYRRLSIKVKQSLYQMKHNLAEKFRNLFFFQIFHRINQDHGCNNNKVTNQEKEVF